MVSRIFVLLTIVFGILSFTTASDIDGTWTGKMGGGPDGEIEMKFVFKVDGDKLTGSVKSPMGDINIVNGKVNGNDFSFDVDFNGMTINHICKLQNGVITMKVPGMEGQATEIILNKVKE